MLRSLASLSTAALLVAAPEMGLAAQVPAEALPVVTHTMDNGMRLVVLPRPGPPTVSFVVRYGVGGVNETLGKTGIAHMLEHLLFKGTTSVGTRDVSAERVLFRRMDDAHDSILALRGRGLGPDAPDVVALRERIEALEDSARTFVVSNEFDRILSRNGARNLNATTDNDATTYFVQLPANRAKLWFVLEADRTSDPVFREFYTERDVVAEERRMRVDTNPGGLLYEAHLAAAYTMHPYRMPVVGYRSDLATLGRRDVEAYYRRYYGPNNAVVSIVGDVEPDSIVAWAESYLGRVPAGDVPPPVLAVEPEQRGERRVEVVFDAEPQLRIGWHVGSAIGQDTPALTMLAYLLTGGRTGRLYRRLVTGDRLATFVGAVTVPGARYPALFTIQAVPRAPHTAAEVEAAIYEELDRMATEPPAEAEMERVRRILEASDVRRLESGFGLAFQLAESTALFGDWRTAFRLSARVRDVTPEDVRRAVGRYFTKQNRTVATLVRPPAATGNGS